MKWGERGSSMAMLGLGRSSEGDKSPLEELELELSSSAFSVSALRFLVPFHSFFDFLIEIRKWQSFSLLGLCWFKMILKFVFSLIESFWCLSLSFNVLRQTILLKADWQEYLFFDLLEPETV